MVRLVDHFRHRRGKPYVRPWALATPIAVLLFCLPLLRPLHHPGQVSNDEELRLATITAIVEDKPGMDTSLAARLAIEDPTFVPQAHLISVNHRLYSDQPPVLAFLLSGPYWILSRFGYRMHEYSVLVPYLLTLIGATLPAAAVGGLVYRMGRIFELPRPWRTALAAALVFASGLISYAVVLNSHVPAAALVLAAMACLIHLAASPNPSRGGGWLVIAGLCAALASVINLWAMVFLILLPVAIVVMRLPPSLRIGGVLLYLLGTTPPIVLHAVLTIHTTGNLLPGSFHPELAVTPNHRMLDADEQPAFSESDSLQDSTGDFSEDYDPNAPQTFWQKASQGFGQFISSLVGQHGLLVHFPVIVLGFAGMLAVMHRHWPLTTKILAAVSAISMGIALITFSAGGYALAASADFANRWLIVFIPILFFWTGAWLRRSHRPSVWWIAGVLLAFSVIVSLIGATDPMPRQGYDRYTVAAALHNLFYPQQPATTAWVDR